MFVQEKSKSGTSDLTLREIQSRTVTSKIVEQEAEPKTAHREIISRSRNQNSLNLNDSNII